MKTSNVLMLYLDERDGMKSSVEQLQSLLHEHKQEISMLQDQVKIEQDENRLLNNRLKELNEKLFLSDSTIDSLQQQIRQMSESESLSRTRVQHESMLANLRHKYEAEVLTLKEKLDDLQQALAWKVKCLLLILIETGKNTTGLISTLFCKKM